MNYELLLETYSLSDILDYNDITDEEALAYLVEQKFVTLPEYQPLDL